MSDYLNYQGTDRLVTKIHGEVIRLEKAIKQAITGGIRPPSSDGDDLSNIQVFMRDGELEIPEWCHSIKLTACGGGARGGASGQGAGGGAEAILGKLFSVTPGDIIPIKIGIGGDHETPNSNGTNTMIGDLITLWGGRNANTTSGGNSGGPGGGHGGANGGANGGFFGFPGIISFGGNPGNTGSNSPSGGGGSLGDGGSGGITASATNTMMGIKETTGIFKGGLPGQSTFATRLPYAAALANGGAGSWGAGGGVPLGPGGNGIAIVEFLEEEYIPSPENMTPVMILTLITGQKIPLFTNSDIIACSTNGANTSLIQTSNYRFIKTEVIHAEFTEDWDRTDIPDYFLMNFTSLKTINNIPEGQTAIGNSFLQGCTSFNQAIILPDSVQIIGNGFLSGCTLFESPLILSSTLKTIGDSFLYNCSKFNQPINLCNGLIKIGTNFMYGCSIFTYPLYIPPSIELIGSYFMYLCQQFTNLHVTPAFLDASPVDGNSFSTTGNSMIVYTHGIDVHGLNDEEFTFLSNRLPDRTASPFRKLNRPVGELLRITLNDEENTLIIGYANSHVDMLASTSAITVNSTIVIGGIRFLRHDIKLVEFGSGWNNTFARKDFPNNFLRAIMNLEHVGDLPDVLTAIGNDFMSGNTGYDEPITIPHSVLTIGSNFMSGCSNFNSPVTLSENLTTIGAGFMQNCVEFDQFLSIPKSVSQTGGIGNNFMNGCNNFTQLMISVESVNAFPATNSATGVLSNSNNTTKQVSTGVSIYGMNNEAEFEIFITRLPDRTTTPFRKLIYVDPSEWVDIDFVTSAIRTLWDNIRNENIITSDIQSDLNLTPIIQPGVNVEWVSSDTNIISNSGKVTPKEIGSAWVTLKATLTRGTITRNVTLLLDIAGKSDFLTSRIGNTGDGIVLGIEAGNDVIVATGSTPASGQTVTSSIVKTSGEGEEWIDRVPSGSMGWNDIGFGETDGFMITSREQSSFTWWSQWTVPGYAWNNVVSGRIQTSMNGQAWTKRNLPTGTLRCDNPVFGNGMWVVLSSNGTHPNDQKTDLTITNCILFSKDRGVTWTRTNTPSNVSFTNLVFGNGIFVATVGKRIFTSADCINWIERTFDTSLFTASIHRIIFNEYHEIFMAVSSDGKQILTSSNGIDWDVKINNLIPHFIPGTSLVPSWDVLVGAGKFFIMVASQSISQNPTNLSISNLSSNIGSRIMITDDGETWVALKGCLFTQFDQRKSCYCSTHNRVIIGSTGNDYMVLDIPYEEDIE